MSETTDLTISDPALEPVPMEGCRVCVAASRGREAARDRGSIQGVHAYNRIIGQHPHRRCGDG